MPAHRRNTYRERITHYCKAHGIAMPRNFDAPCSSSRYALIDTTEHPTTIFPRTAYARKDLVAFALRPEHAGRTLRVLDFRTGKEFRLGAGTALVECGTFDPSFPGEVLYLVAP